jgi:hypothetical protein
MKLIESLKFPRLITNAIAYRACNTLDIGGVTPSTLF